MNTLDFYKSVLGSLGLTTLPIPPSTVVTDDDEQLPITVHAKPLVMPTKVNLDNPQFDKLVYFHPLSEDVLSSKQSAVFKRLRTLINTRLNTVSWTLGCELVKIAADTKKHKTLRTDQHVLVQLLQNANQKTVRAYEKLLRSDLVDDNVLLDVYVKVNGVYRANKCVRTAITTFGFKDLKDDSDTQFMGVDLSTQRDKNTIKALFDYMFNNQGDEDHYNFGSNDATAPSLHALLGGLLRVGGRLNELIRLFDNVLSSEFKESLGLSFKPIFEWEAGMSAFNTMSFEIPPLPENTGSIIGKDTDGQNTNQKIGVKTETQAAPTTASGLTLTDILNQREQNQPRNGSGGFGNRSHDEPSRSDFGRDRDTRGGWGNSSDRGGFGKSTSSSGFGRSGPTLNDINVPSNLYNSWGN